MIVISKTTHLQNLIDCATRLKTAIETQQDKETLVFLRQLRQTMEARDLKNELLVIRGHASRQLGHEPVRLDFYLLETEDWLPWVQIVEETEGRIIGQGLLGNYWNMFAAGTTETLAKMEAIPGKGTTWWLNETPSGLELEDDDEP
jgi:hypothetical protein